MKIQFSCKFQKNKTKEDLEIENEEKELAQLLGNEYKPKVKFEYDSLVEDTSNIVGWNSYDKDHVSLRTELGEVFIIKADKDTFNKRWQEITGEVIHVI